MLLFGLLFAAWMLPGLMGRDPWKADEAYSFGLVLNMVQHGDYVVPTLGADPFMEKPPVFYITASICGRLFSPPLPLHVAVRGACVVFLLLTLLFLGLASRELNGRGKGWVAAVLLLGCVGLVHTAHMLMTDNALVTGFAMALYGLALGRRRAWLGGVWCGTGAGVAFLAKGLLGPGIIGLVMFCLPAVFPEWRTKQYWRLLAGAALGALPWVCVWPMALYQRSPELFQVWFWDNNFGRFLGKNNLVTGKSTPLFYLKKLPHFAWPVLPLALWALWKERQSILRKRGLGLPLLAFLLTLFVLSTSKQCRENYGLPMLAPLSLLAARASLPAGFLRWARVGVFIVVGALAGVVWFGWAAQFTGTPAVVLAKIQAKVPEYVPSFNAWGFGVALLATLGWVFFASPASDRVLRSFWTVENRPTPDEGMLYAHWAAGIALLYLLGMTLFLPVTNSNMSYRKDFVGLREALGKEPGTIASKNLGEPQRAVLHYYAGVTTWQQETRRPTNYNWILIQGEDKQGQRPMAPEGSWEQVWEGRHHREMFCLYHRKK
jgi:4-amino-4-deoxy-L-arabinose transferase-like glycosyltransferase